MPDVFNKQLTIITKLKSNSKTKVATIEQLISENAKNANKIRLT